MAAGLIRIVGLIAACAALGCGNLAVAQDLEPRRWTPLPPGLTIAGAGYAVTRGDVFFDPVLLIEDAEVEGHSAVASLVHSFTIANRRARLDVAVPWHNMTWTGLLDGAPASASRVGPGDPWVRLSLILAESNAPAGSPTPTSTVFGAAVAVGLPLGEYLEGKLLNLGQNRLVVRPQVGMTHTRGKWSYELTGSTFLYGSNDEFERESKLEQDPLYATQAHIIRFFDTAGYWASLSAGYAWGGQSTIDNVQADDRRRLFLSALAFGMPVRDRQSLKFTYLRTRTRTDNGSDTDSLSVGWSWRF